MPSDPAAWLLYFVTDEGGREDLLRQAQAAMEGGAGAVQLRLKGVDDDAWLSAGRELAAICRRRGVPFIINDRPDLAVALGADGVHVGREDADVARAREQVGRGRIVGVSVHGPGEAARARSLGADYVAVGPVYPSVVKGEVAPVGLTMLRAVREATDLPLIAIGGISPANAAAAMAAGADGVAVITAISRAPEPAAAAAVLLQAAREGLRLRGGGK
jgi:thiamine-phosphate diphosphorylase